MKKFSQLLIAGFVFSGLLFTSCSSDDDNYMPEIEEPGEFDQGVFILNEGNYGAGNASVSFMNMHGEVSHNIFQATNGTQLGDVAQSIYTHENYAYIVLNGSATVEVVDRYSFESVASISTGLENPRYFIVENGKGYVSNWGDPTDPNDDYLAVINLSNFSIESTIPVSEGPEKMLAKNGKIYVAQMGGWGYGNTISVINAQNDSFEGEIEVADVPHSMVENNGTLYVLSSGKAAWTEDETKGGIASIDLNSNALISIFELSEGQHPTHLELDGNKLFYTVDADVYTVTAPLVALPNAPLFSLIDQEVFGAYGFAVNNNKIYIADAADYQGNGDVYIYDLNGNLTDNFSVGFLPNDFGFNN